MKNGIPCDEYSEIGSKNQNHISFRFVTDDKNTPSSCTISLGDLDPMTGEPLTDLTIFRDYHKKRNRFVSRNKRQASVPLTSREEKARKALKEQIAADFEQEYGYPPNKDTLYWLLNEKYPKKYRKEIDSMVNEDNEFYADFAAEIADPTAEEAFRTAEGCLLDSLNDFAETLTERQQDVLEMLIRKAEGEPVHGMGLKLAEKWGVGKTQISMDRIAIGKKLMIWMREHDFE